MLKIGLRDLEFEHIHSPTCYAGYDAPKYIEWDRETPLSNDIVVYTDRCLPELETSTAKIKVAWLLESEVIRPEAYQWARSGGISKADYVISHTQSILQLCPEKSVWFPAGCGWLFRNEIGINDKNKCVSIIASAKNYAPGHIFRHTVIKEIGNMFDLVCGYGYIPVEPKKLAFLDYMFTVVIENNRSECYFTDKLLDPILLGTIPIFWGNKSILKMYNTDGIMFFNTVDELKEILLKIRLHGKEIYDIMLPAIKENYEIAKNYLVVEDYLYEALFKRI